MRRSWTPPRSRRASLRIAEPLVELLEQTDRRVGDHRARRKDRIDPRRAQRLEILFGNDAANHDHRIAEADLAQRRPERGSEREMAGGERGNADDMRTLARRLDE